MRLVVTSNVEHDGIIYTQGEIIEDIKKQDGDRLIKLGVAKLIEDEKKEEKKTPSKKKATNDKEEPDK